jgi:alpha-ketoglutarate-dependent taurine dioxygenase
VNHRVAILVPCSRAKTQSMKCFTVAAFLARLDVAKYSAIDDRRGFAFSHSCVMKSISIRSMACTVGVPLTPAGGVTITDLDLSRPLSPEVREHIREAFRDYHVVIFPDQELSREQQHAFTANFGEIEAHGGRNPQTKRYKVAHVISNLDSAGNPVDRSSSPVSNYRWHTDKPYYPVPPMLTALYAVELPPQGGDTEFANTAMGYAALPAEIKRRIAGLRVVFYWGASAGTSVGSLPTQVAPREYPPIDHPLVRTHPETGAKALYLGNHASHILGMSETEGRALLGELVEHTTKPQFVYTHRWRKGDLVIWDNRCLLHRAVANYEMGRYPRVLHRSVVRGTVPF